MNFAANFAAHPACAEVRILELEALVLQRWQPIETAPRDGAEILAWREDCGLFIASFTSLGSPPLSQPEIDATDDEALVAGGWFTQQPHTLRLDDSEAPTHWMPLPMPPKTDGAA